MDKYAAAVDTRDANRIAYTHWATTLNKLGRETESLTKYAGIFDFEDAYVHYDFASSRAAPQGPERAAAGAANPKSLEQAPTNMSAPLELAAGQRLEPDPLG